MEELRGASSMVFTAVFMKEFLNQVPDIYRRMFYEGVDREWDEID